MISVIEQGEQYFVRFRYDPDMIAHVKNVPGRHWDSKEKAWTIPKQHLGWLLNEVKGTKYEQAMQIYSGERLNENATLDATAKTEIPDIDLSDMDFYAQDGSHLYAHQLDFLRYAKSRAGKGFILADEMGCGKTLEVMNYALYMRKAHGYKHCLIICCVNPAKYSWQGDIFKHTNHTEQAYILGTRRKKSGIVYSTAGTDKLEDLKTGHQYGDTAAPKLPYL